MEDGKRIELTLGEAFTEEIRRGKSLQFVFLTPPTESECDVCRKVDGCEWGVCSNCRDLVRTDKVNVWEIANPANTWPYVWVDTSKHVSEEQLAALEDWFKVLGESFLKEKLNTIADVIALWSDEEPRG